MKSKCEKAEREKSDVLLRRLASLDTTPTSRTTASEVKKKKIHKYIILCLQFVFQMSVLNINLLV